MTPCPLNVQISLILASLWISASLEIFGQIVFFFSLPFGFCYFSSNHHKNCKFGRNLIFFCWNSIYFSRGIWWFLHNWSISTPKKVIQAQSWEKWSFWSQKKPYHFKKVPLGDQNGFKNFLGSTKEMQNSISSPMGPIPTLYLQRFPRYGQKTQGWSFSIVTIGLNRR